VVFGTLLGLIVNVNVDVGAATATAATATTPTAARAKMAADRLLIRIFSLLERVFGAALHPRRDMGTATRSWCGQSNPS
jgi:hypothetical protein